ncbi:hypothetical protein BDV93DRAFT_555714 [Ceratobasidium sp. AG-I]|nr:hypothetical protein BDV93DRAFT_555714 [Ceratobasidium sp. AG-I]
MKIVWKAAQKARRLRYNPGAKRAFKEACKAKAMATPYSVQCDVVMRWNSTEETLRDTDWTWDGLYIFFSLQVVSETIAYIL